MINEHITITVTEEYIDIQRLDLLLTRFLNQTMEISRSLIKRCIIEGSVKLIREQTCYEIKEPDFKIKLQDIYTLNLEKADKPPLLLKPLDLDLDILYEDEHITVVNKIANLTTHPGTGNYDKTLVNALLFKYNNNLSNYNGAIRPGIVHRLDKNTSGLLVIAKNNKAHIRLSKQFFEHTTQREYRALVWGKMKEPLGNIESYIIRSERNRLKMAFHQTKGKYARTHYKVLKCYQGILSLVNLTLFTGRTHQIRVHMNYLGNSVVGDDLYTQNTEGFLQALSSEQQSFISKLQRQLLHAYKLGFQHPVTKEKLLFIKYEDEYIKKFYHELFQDIN